jgi:hypothetical protein
MQEPLSNHEVDTVKYFTCTKPGHCMFRTDGKKILFNFGVYAAKIEEDQKFLLKEIRQGHPDIRLSTDQEIEAYEMRTDPKGAIEKNLRPQIEAEVRQDLNLQIAAELRKKSEALGLTEAQINALLGTEPQEPVNPLAGVGMEDRPQNRIIETDTAKLRLGGVVGTNKLAGAAPISGK